MMRVFRAICRVWGVSAIFLVFLACDGPIPGYYAMKGNSDEEEILIRGYVYEAGNPDKKPIEGIAVFVQGVTANYAFLTNAAGEFSFYVPKQDKYTLIFTDIDGDKNGGEFQQFITAPPLSQEEVEDSSETPLEFDLTLQP